MTALLLAAALMGPPDPVSFPSYTQNIEARMRVSKIVGWSLFACDAVTTFASKDAREVHPLAFGSKPLGVTLSALATWQSIRLEEKALRVHRKRRANFIRWTRWVWMGFVCGWNITVTF